MADLPARASIRLTGYDYSGAGGYFVTLCINHRLSLFGDIVIREGGVGADPRVCPDCALDGAAGEHMGSPLRMPLDGEPVEMRLSPAGEMIERWWNKIPEKFPAIECDAFVIMPNHIHFIVINKTGMAVGADPRVCPDFGVEGGHVGSQAGGHVGPPLLGSVVQWFKTMTTNEYIRGVKDSGWPRFEKRLWQRNYWEHIVRDNEWDNLRSYIWNNPLHWAADKLNPDHKMP